MNEMEMKARANHRNGNNCSASLAMGYTNVFEFGGIIDWTGEVVTGED